MHKTLHPGLEVHERNPKGPRYSRPPCRSCRLRRDTWTFDYGISQFSVQDLALITDMRSAERVLRYVDYQENILVTKSGGDQRLALGV